MIVAGIGPGHPDFVLPAALRAIREAKVLLGGSRALADFAREGQETRPIAIALTQKAKHDKLLFGQAGQKRVAEKIVGGAGNAHGDGTGNTGGAFLVRVTFIHVSVNQTEGNGVDTDPAGTKFFGESLGESVHSALGSRISYFA